MFIRSIHLGFALLIVYLNYPVFKETRFGLKFLSVKNRIPLWEFVIAIIACFSAVYIAIDYAGINERYGAPITRDLIVGLVLLLIAEVDQRVEILHALGADIAALATIAAIWPAELNEFFPPERNAAISSIAGFDVNFCLVEEFHICNVS